MNLGRKLKTLEAKRSIYLVELIFGLLLLGSCFIPIVGDSLFNQYEILGVPIKILIAAAVIGLIIYTFVRYLANSESRTIEIYEKGIKIEDFESSYEDLEMRIKGNKFKFSNGVDTIVYNNGLDRDNLDYLKSLNV